VDETLYEWEEEESNPMILLDDVVAVRLEENQRVGIPSEEVEESG